VALGVAFLIFRYAGAIRATAPDGFGDAVERGVLAQTATPRLSF
jgi:hypothetical protein